MQKKLKDIPKFWGQIQKLILIKILVSSVRFALSVLTARYLGAEGRGLLFSLQNIVGLVVTGCCLSIGEAITYFWNKNQISIESLQRLHWFASILFGLIAAVGTITTLIFISLDVTTFSQLIYLSVLLTIVTVHEYLLMSVLKAQMKFLSANLFFLSIRIATLLVILLGRTARPWPWLCWHTYYSVSSALFFVCLWQNRLMSKIKIN